MLKEEEDTFKPFVPRSVWKGEKKPTRTYMDKIVTMVFYSFTCNDSCSPDDDCGTMQHMLQKHAREMENVRYNFLIDAEGRVFIGRDWRSRPALPPGWKDYENGGYYIGLIGCAEGSKTMDPVFEAQEKIIKFGIANNYIAPKFLDFTFDVSALFNLK